MTKTALITGITGQDGSYLAELLLEKGYEVHGIIRRSSSSNTTRIDKIISDLVIHYGDLADSNQIVSIMTASRPDEVYNLAAQSHPGISFEIPEYTGNITALGTTRLLEAIRKICPSSRFYQASSSEMFGAADPPQNENTPFHPISPYACSKLYAYWMVRNYREGYGIYAVNGISFNHESPRRGEQFVTRKITKAVAAIKAGKQEYLSLGNLEAKRDWGYAPEYVKGMWEMLQLKTPDDFVLGTGETHSVQEFVDVAFEYVGLDKSRYIRQEADLCRPIDSRVLCADASHAKEVFGWEPNTRFYELIKLMVDADMKENTL